MFSLYGLFETILLVCLISGIMVAGIPLMAYVFARTAQRNTDYDQSS
jgi:hypothetical protein